MPNINRKVKVSKVIDSIDKIIKITVVFGRFNRFKSGPKIVSNKPITREIKNLGYRNTFSQKSGILILIFYKKLKKHEC